MGGTSRSSVRYDLVTSVRYTGYQCLSDFGSDTKKVRKIRSSLIFVLACSTIVFVGLRGDTKSTLLIF